MSKKYIDIGRGGGGWFAVLTVADASGHMEPHDTGIGRYRRKESAIAEAAEWSKSDGIPLHPDLIPLIKKAGSKK